MFILNRSRFFFVKIQKFWGAPIETSDFLKVCADFDRIWHKQRWPTACERRSCEHARNVRTKNLEKASRAKIVRKRAKRAKIRTKKNLEKASRAKIVRNVRKSVRKKPSCERCEHFIQIPLFVEISPRKSPILPQNLHIQISDRKSHGLAQKNLNILFSDRKPPEFALKSVHWIF